MLQSMEVFFFSVSLVRKKSSWGSLHLFQCSWAPETAVCSIWTKCNHTHNNEIISGYWCIINSRIPNTTIDWEEKLPHWGSTSQTPSGGVAPCWPVEEMQSQLLGVYSHLCTWCSFSVVALRKLQKLGGNVITNITWCPSFLHHVTSTACDMKYIQ